MYVYLYRFLDGQSNTENNQQQFDTGHVQLPQHSQATNNTGEGTFRHPLPPGIVRPRMPIQSNVLIRNQIGNILHFLSCCYNMAMKYVLYVLFY